MSSSSSQNGPPLPGSEKDFSDVHDRFAAKVSEIEKELGSLSDKRRADETQRRLKERNEWELAEQKRIQRMQERKAQYKNLEVLKKAATSLAFDSLNNSSTLSSSNLLSSKREKSASNLYNSGSASALSSLSVSVRSSAINLSPSKSLLNLEADLSSASPTKSNPDSPSKSRASVLIDAFQSERLRRKQARDALLHSPVSSPVAVAESALRAPVSRAVNPDKQVQASVIKETKEAVISSSSFGLRSTEQSQIDDSLVEKLNKETPSDRQVFDNELSASAQASDKHINSLGPEFERSEIDEPSENTISKSSEPETASDSPPLANVELTDSKSAQKDLNIESDEPQTAVKQEDELPVVNPASNFPRTSYLEQNDARDATNEHVNPKQTNLDEPQTEDQINIVQHIQQSQEFVHVPDQLTESDETSNANTAPTDNSLAASGSATSIQANAAVLEDETLYKTFSAASESASSRASSAPEISLPQLPASETLLQDASLLNGDTTANDIDVDNLLASLDSQVIRNAQATSANTLEKECSMSQDNSAAHTLEFQVAPSESSELVKSESKPAQTPSILNSKDALATKNTQSGNSIAEQSLESLQGLNPTLHSAGSRPAVDSKAEDEFDNLARSNSRRPTAGSMVAYLASKFDNSGSSDSFGASFGKSQKAAENREGVGAVSNSGLKANVSGQQSSVFSKSVDSTDSSGDFGDVPKTRKKSILASFHIRTEVGAKASGLYPLHASGISEDLETCPRRLVIKEPSTSSSIKQLEDELVSALNDLQKPSSAKRSSINSSLPQKSRLDSDSSSVSSKITSASLVVPSKDVNANHALTALDSSKKPTSLEAGRPEPTPAKPSKGLVSELVKEKSNMQNTKKLISTTDLVEQYLGNDRSSLTVSPQAADAPLKNFGNTFSAKDLIAHSELIESQPVASSSLPLEQDSRTANSDTFAFKSGPMKSEPTGSQVDTNTDMLRTLVITESFGQQSNQIAVPEDSIVIHEQEGQTFGISDLMKILWPNSANEKSPNVPEAARASVAASIAASVKSHSVVQLKQYYDYLNKVDPAAAAAAASVFNSGSHSNLSLLASIAKNVYTDFKSNTITSQQLPMDSSDAPTLSAQSLRLFTETPTLVVSQEHDCRTNINPLQEATLTYPTFERAPNRSSFLPMSYLSVEEQSLALLMTSLSQGTTPLPLGLDDVSVDETSSTLSSAAFRDGGATGETEVVPPIAMFKKKETLPASTSRVSALTPEVPQASSAAGTTKRFMVVSPLIEKRRSSLLNQVQQPLVNHLQGNAVRPRTPVTGQRNSVLEAEDTIIFGANSMPRLSKASETLVLFNKKSFAADDSTFMRLSFSVASAKVQPAQCLYQIQGRRKHYMLRVIPSNVSVVSSSCFIFVIPDPVPAVVDKRRSFAASARIFVWLGSKAGNVKRSKTNDFAVRIRDQEWNSKATIQTIEEGDSNNEFSALFADRGCEVESSATSHSAFDDDDDMFDRVYAEGMILYGTSSTLSEDTERVLSMTNHSRMEVKASNGRNLSVKLLQQDEAFVLDDGQDELYVWCGKHSTQLQRDTAYTWADYLLRSSSRPFIQLRPQRNGAEEVIFREKFIDWGEGISLKPKELTNPVLPDKSRYVYDRGGDAASAIQQTSPAAASKIDVAAMHKPPPPLPAWNRGNPGTFEEYELPTTDAKGISLQIWHVSGEPEQRSIPPKRLLPVSEHAEFYSEETYILLYEQEVDNEKKVHVLYYWIGLNAPLTDQAAVALEAITVGKRLEARQERITQGKEPVEFIKACSFALSSGNAGRPNYIVLNRGKRSSPVAVNRLFQVEQTSFTKAGTFSICECSFSASSLCSKACFIALTKDKCFVWVGSASFPGQVAAALSFAQTKNLPVVEAQEKSEPKAFWAAFGSSDKKGHEYSNFGQFSIRSQLLKHCLDTVTDESLLQELLRRYSTRLFRISHIVHGLPSAEEIEPFVQSDLSPDGIYIVDAYCDVFVWVGPGARSDYRNLKLAVDTATAYTDYVKRLDPLERAPLDKSKSLFIVHGGFEPLLFTSQFVAWDVQRARMSLIPYISSLDAGLSGASQAEQSPSITKPSSGNWFKMRLKSAKSKIVGSVQALNNSGEGSATQSPTSPVTSAKATLDALASQRTPMQLGQFIETCMEGQYSLSQLKPPSEVPFGVDPCQIELYLNDSDFDSAFHMTKSEYKRLPDWKQLELKKRIGFY